MLIEHEHGQLGMSIKGFLSTLSIGGFVLQELTCRLDVVPSGKISNCVQGSGVAGSHLGQYQHQHHDSE